MSKDDARAALADAFAGGGAQGIAGHYAAWADSYDADAVALGFRTPALCAALFARHVPLGAGPLLDAGCGTGLAGELLSILGYDDLTGLDLTPAMLDRARARGLYARLVQADLARPLDLPTDSFAGVIASGVFTEGHAPAAAFDEIARITRPGGHVVFNVKTDILETEGFAAKIAALEAAGRWHLVERSAQFRAFFDPDTDARGALRLPGQSLNSRSRSDQSSGLSSR